MRPHGELVFIWPSRGATSHSILSLKHLSEDHLSAHPEQQLAFCLCLSSLSPHVISFKFLCEQECRLIPALFCNAQEHLIACRQKSSILATEGSSQASIVGEVVKAVLTADRVAALSQSEQPQQPFPSASLLSILLLNILYMDTIRNSIQAD